MVLAVGAHGAKVDDRESRSAPPRVIASSTPAPTAGIRFFGIAPPVTSLSNSNPEPAVQRLETHGGDTELAVTAALLLVLALDLDRSGRASRGRRPGRRRPRLRRRRARSGRGRRGRGSRRSRSTRSGGSSSSWCTASVGSSTTRRRSVVASRSSSDVLALRSRRRTPGVGSVGSGTVDGGALRGERVAGARGRSSLVTAAMSPATTLPTDRWAPPVSEIRW